MSITKTFKGYGCQISKTPIFWTINSIDKPSKKCFDLVEFSEVNFTPNFIDQFTVQLVADSTEYTLLKIYEIYDTVDSDKPDTTATSWENEKIFINSKVNRILKNGFLLTFDLDIYTTYFFTLFEKSKYQYLHVNRGYHNEILKSELRDYFMCQPDPLLNFDECGFYPIKQKWTSLHSYRYANKSITGPKEFIYISNTDPAPGLGNSTGMKLKSMNERPNKAMAYVYQLADGTYFFIVDIGTFTATKSDNQYFNYTIYSGQYVHNEIIQKKNAFGWLQNKFIGVFNIPFINYLPNLTFWNALGYYENGDKGSSFKKYFEIDTNNTGMGALCFFIKPNEPLELVRGGVNTVTIDWGELGDLYYTNPNTTFYYYFNMLYRDATGPSATPNYYVIAKAYYEDFKMPVLHPNLSWLGNGYLTFDGSNFNFSPAYKMGNIIKSTNNKVSNWDDCYYITPDILTFYGTYNTATDSYKEYINSVKSQQNTGLQLAKQQAIFSGLTGGLSNLLNMGEDAADGDGLGFLKSTLKFGTGIASSILKYQNKEKQIQAKNEDKRRVAKANNISSSVSSDDMNNKRNGLSATYYNDGFTGDIDNYFCNIINIRLPNKWQYEKMKNIMGSNGFYINSTITMDTRFLNPSETGASFTILDFEISEINLRRYFPNADDATIEAMKIIIKNSFIFWDKLDWVDYLGEYNQMYIPGWSD